MNPTDTASHPVPSSLRPPPVEENALVQIGGGSGIPFNGNQIKTAVASLPPEQAQEIVWLYQHGRDRHFDLQTLASKLRLDKGTYSDAALYAVFRGRYQGALDQIVAAIRVYREIHESREKIIRPDFICTDLTRRVHGVCDRTRSYNRVTFLFGDGQIGKTKNLEEYARFHQSTTRYLRLPTEAPLRQTVQDLATACYLNAERGTIRSQIIAHFDPQMLLIVDELQQITLARTERDRLVTVEFLREIFDRSGCGLLLCGTNEAMQEMESGPNARWLRQLRRRAFRKIKLPNVASDADILAFAAHFGLGEEMPADAVDETRQIATVDGVGLLITYFQGAARMAAAERQVVTWEHFLRTVKAFAEEN